MEPLKATSVNSRAEELFVQLFCEAFGPEKTENLQVQYPCVDIYGRHRYIDFALESPESKIAIEIDGETYHNPSKVSENKYADDLLKQNSLVYDNWKVYRWIYSQLEKQPEKVKDELITFLGSSPMFKAFEADLPVQMGQTIELRDYQQEAIENLKKVRDDGKTIAVYEVDDKQVILARTTARTTTKLLHIDSFGHRWPCHKQNGGMRAVPAFVQQIAGAQYVR